MTPLQSDYLTLATFLDALFRYADDGTFVSWRAFRDDTKDAPPVFIESSRLEPNARFPLAPLADDATRLATRAAQFPQPAVFCPPIATFTNPTRAREQDLANGLALSVECDATPQAARETLEELLGAATVVVASGGLTADGEDKLHLHWRLSEPTSSPQDHARLKRARILATAIVGGDATNVPAVHPIRWPGSWHRKGEPRIATIISHTDRELVLSDALELLELAAPTAAPRLGTAPAVTGAISDTGELIRQLITGEAMHAPLVALAYRYLKGGMTDAQTVLTLRGLMDAIPGEARGADARWQGHYNDIPRTVRTAREKVGAGEPAPAIDLTEFNASLVEAPNVIVARKPDVVKDIPAELLAPPGILGDIARYGVETAHKPVPIFAVQAALALGSVVCGRRYVTTNNNYSSLYFLNVAKSGTGKEHAKRTVERVLDAAGASRRLLGSSAYSSGNAIFSALLDKPQHIMIADEFGKYLEAASGDRGDPYKSDVLTKLMEAFGRVDGTMVLPQFSTMTKGAPADRPTYILRPAITVLAMTTPSTFYQAMHSTRIMDGFLNRFLVVEHQAPRLPSVPVQSIDVPANVVRWVQQILAPHGDMDLGTQIDTVGAARVVEINEPSMHAFQAFELEMIDLANSLEADGLGEMAIRAHEVALRLALICTMAEQPDTPVMTSDLFDWAASYVRFFLQQTIESVRTRVADSHTERTRNTILAAIRAAGMRGISNKELHRGRLFVGIPRRDRDEAIESLQRGELVAWMDIPHEGPKGGRPRKALVAIEETAGLGEMDELVSKPELLAS